MQMKAIDRRPGARTLAWLAVAALGAIDAYAVEKAVVIPAPLLDEAMPSEAPAVAVLAGGCFWGVQGVFQHTDGVIEALSGYAGGTADSANYEAVSRGDTKHAEAVRITYDPAKITYGRLLQIFFSVAHDPTQLNRQGPDYGRQYRSAIFPADERQRSIAAAYIEQLTAAAVFDGPIVTLLEDQHEFYAAEPYHQDFVFRNPSYPYVVINDAPKIKNLERHFGSLFRSEPMLVNRRMSGRH
jgi:peptide-methionine (S)-S-oxide reductase